MRKEALLEIIERAGELSGIVIAGAGMVGQSFAEYLSKFPNVTLAAFFDNSVEKEGDFIQGIPVSKPRKLDGSDPLYVIAAFLETIQRQLRKQLLESGVDESRIAVVPSVKDEEYYRSLKEEDYKEEVSEMYRKRFGRELNWENPQTYTEIINCEKILVHDKRRTLLADKVKVRDYIKEKIGEQYLTKRYGVWDDANDIDFDALPQSFALKLNHASTFNIIIKDKAKMDKEAVCRQLNEWRDINYAFLGGLLELHYRDIPPKIICEEYLEGLAESVYDYNIYCFHGVPQYIWCIKGSHKPECKASFYDKDWNMQEFSFGYPLDPDEAPRPAQLDEMLRLSGILCQDFEHVRVDWYNLSDGRVLFGELTFTTWAGVQKFDPPEYDQLFGDLVRGKKH